MSRDLRYRIAYTLAFAVLSVMLPKNARAQQHDSVYAASQLSSPPRLASTKATVELARKSYPQALRETKQGGSVELEFVVDQQGKVDPATIQVVASSSPALAEAVKSIADRIEFIPALMGGMPVRTSVILPVTFKP